MATGWSRRPGIRPSDKDDIASRKKAAEIGGLLLFGDILDRLGGAAYIAGHDEARTAFLSPPPCPSGTGARLAVASVPPDQARGTRPFRPIRTVGLAPVLL